MQAEPADLLVTAQAWHRAERLADAGAACEGLLEVDPEAHLGITTLQVLDGIRDRILLDLFELDFEVDASGQIVFFQASAAIIFHAMNDRAPADARLPLKPFERVDNAFSALVAWRIAETTRDGRP